MDKKYNKGEIAKIILKSLAVGGVVVAVVALPGLAQVLTLFKPSNAQERQRIKQSVYGLKKQKLIHIYNKNGKEIVEITEKGKKRILQYDFEDMKVDKSRRWDGFWRIIIFDIPEKKKRVRNLINFKLKDMDFYPLQKSTFVLPYECKNEIDFMKEYLGVGKNIVYIKSKEISDDERLKKYFNLPVE